MRKIKGAVGVYDTAHTQMNVVIERIFSVFKEGGLAVLPNAELNDTTQKLMLAEYVHTCERLRISMDIISSTKSPLKGF